METQSQPVVQPGLKEPLQSADTGLLSLGTLSQFPDSVLQSLNLNGWAQVKSYLSREDCIQLRGSFDIDTHFRKTIVMERYRFGLGMYKYYRYPLPDLI